MLLKGEVEKMSKYTTEIRFILEKANNLTVSQDYPSVDEIINNGRQAIFDFDYPIFDVNYKPILERKILKHFYVREIGSETVGLFKLFLSRKMNEIMPYYNKLYQSELIDFNPLYTENLTKDYHKDNVSTGNGNSNTKTDNTKTNTHSANETEENSSTSNTEAQGTSSNNSTSTTDGTDHETSRTDLGHSQSDRIIYSDTPQNDLSQIENGTYATNATFEAHSYNDGTDYNTDSTNHSQTVSTATGNTTDNRETTNQYNGTTNKTSNTSDVLDGNRDVMYTNNRDTDDDYLGHVVGISGKSPSKLLEEYRKTFLNIDMMIIRDLEPLFYKLW